MNIYIPHHLRNIKIVDQMYRMIQEYSTNDEYSINTDNSFDDYYSYLATDPVKKFVEFNISKDIVNNNNQSYEDIINYITKLFYSVKGTIKVIEFMSKYLNLTTADDFFYSPKYVKLSFKSINTVNDELFYNLLNNFLNALLYYSDSEPNITTNSLDISDTIESYVGNNLITYKVFNTNSIEVIDMNSKN